MYYREYGYEFILDICVRQWPLQLKRYPVLFAHHSCCWQLTRNIFKTKQNKSNIKVDAFWYSRYDVKRNIELFPWYNSNRIDAIFRTYLLYITESTSRDFDNISSGYSINEYKSKCASNKNNNNNWYMYNEMPV